MRMPILLPIAAALLVATAVSADQVVTHDPVTHENLTVRVPGSLGIIPERETIESFDPTRAPRDPCNTMIITSTTEKSPSFSSFARMPDRRRPVVECGPTVVPVQTARLVEPPVLLAQVEPMPVVQPYVEPARYVPPAPLELPHTGSSLPLIGLLGLLALGGATLLRIGRSLAS